MAFRVGRSEVRAHVGAVWATAPSKSPEPLKGISNRKYIPKVKNVQKLSKLFEKILTEEIKQFAEVSKPL